MPGIHLDVRKAENTDVRNTEAAAAADNVSLALRNDPLVGISEYVRIKYEPPSCGGC